MGLVRRGELISMRGGSFNFDRHELRCAYRYGYNAARGLAYRGSCCFRNVI